MEHAMVKLNIHSVIDLITNSSTEIFINCSNSIEPTKELLTELLTLFGSEKNTLEEVFDIYTEYDKESASDFIQYSAEYEDSGLYNKLNIGENLSNKDERILIEKYVDEINNGNKPVPKTFSYNVQIFLKIVSKEPKFDKFIVLLDKFFNSAEYYEYGDG